MSPNRDTCEGGKIELVYVKMFWGIIEVKSFSELVDLGQLPGTHHPTSFLSYLSPVFIFYLFIFMLSNLTMPGPFLTLGIRDKNMMKSLTKGTF